MTGIQYHYQGMKLHYLSEDLRYAVYHREPKPGDKPEVYWNPYVVYRTDRVINKYGYPTLSFKKLGRYADIKSAVYSVWDVQGYGH